MNKNLKKLEQEIKDIKYLLTVLKKYPAFGKKRDIKNLNETLKIKNNLIKNFIKK